MKNSKIHSIQSDEDICSILEIQFVTFLLLQNAILGVR